MKPLVLLTAVALLCGAGTGALAYKPQTGDIVFHTSASAQSVAVQAATHSRYSHMGVVIVRKGQPWVLEAVQPVQYTRLQAWLDRGTGRHYVIKRLKAPLTDAQMGAMATQGQAFVGKPYDLTFEWNDDRIYCSELVWKLYRSSAGIELSPLSQLGSFDLSSAVVKAKLKERYADHVPLDHPVVPPSAIFDSSLLATVDQR
ncbi:MAG: hypothetical protein RI907_248 [Pseudomonadota bacterium]|jgi:uncharacterized protein YycO